MHRHFFSRGQIYRLEQCTPSKEIFAVVMMCKGSQPEPHRVLSRNFLFGGGGGGSFKYIWEGPTRSAKILQRMHRDKLYMKIHLSFGGSGLSQVQITNGQKGLEKQDSDN